MAPLLYTNMNVDTKVRSYLRRAKKIMENSARKEGVELEWEYEDRTHQIEIASMLQREEHKSCIDTAYYDTEVWAKPIKK